ncbi:hypothetical protein BCPR1_01395 [Bacillus paranthracis]|nr:hypothetical protein BK722_10900 [Bacillus thuringiensis serovar finitimus]QCU13246.1 hypothetical protein BCPR1_01395 [Bacillus paranthracis]
MEEARFAKTVAKRASVVYPAICRAVRPPTSKFNGSKEVRWGGQLPVKARLVRANNQWGMNKTPTD